MIWEAYLAGKEGKPVLRLAFITADFWVGAALSSAQERPRRLVIGHVLSTGTRAPVRRAR
jgi:hypothetical protein